MKKELDDLEHIVRFLHEVGSLKNVDRTGWKTVCAPNETVAEHSHRTAVIAYILAKMANMSLEDENIIIKSALFHDLHETRITDLHIIAKKYVKTDQKKCEDEQICDLPLQIREDIRKNLQLPHRLMVYLKDADKLECAFRAKEYLDLGYRTEEWIENTKSQIKTNEAKKLFETMLKADSAKWIFDIKNKNRTIPHVYP